MSTTRTLATAGTVALLVLATGGVAAADEVTGGRAETYRNALRGQGQATTEATVSEQSGALHAETRAQAGRPLLGLIGGTSTAGATAGVQNTFAVDEGSYLVTFTYRGLRTSTDAAAGAAASVVANSVATFTSADETDKTPRPFIDFTEVDQYDGTLTVTVRVTAPEAGSLWTAGRLTASSHSTRPGATARAEATSTGTSVRVNPS